jgi:fumarate hydratase class I
MTTPSSTAFRKLSDQGVRLESFQGQDLLVVEPEAIELLSKAAFEEINFFLRTKHLEQLRAIVDDSEASNNDRFVALHYLKNSVIASGGVLPMCQDTGTAIIMGKKGQRIWSAGDDKGALSRGVLEAYAERNLRYSQLAPLSMFEEKNTRNNLPAQVDLFADGPDEEYNFLFMAKGGGSANKTFLFQSTPSALEESRLEAFLDEKIKTLGTAACPPYHLAVVIGGLSAEQNLKTVKLASARYLDDLPTQGSEDASPYRDLEWEARILEMTRNMGIGAQFGGKYYCHDVRVIRLARHGASLPIGLGVSCGADRQALGKITRDGIFLEQLEHDPARFLPDIDESALSSDVISVNLNEGMEQTLAKIANLPVSTRVNLTGTIIVARDAAHAKLRARLDAGEPLPDYFKNSPIYYAGPAKKPEGYASGAFGPTTAGRMDSFMKQFQATGGALVTLAKGNRSEEVREACATYGGVYLGTIGGVAAKLAEESIKAMEVVEYPELGMEAIWRIEVEDFPAFVIINAKGEDFFQGIL